jgi:GWxTD domain-containing protein
VDLYRQLLQAAGPQVHDATGPEPTVESVLRRRVAQMAALMDSAALGRVIEQPRSAPVRTWRFQPGAGEALLRWWRDQDALPATPENERLEEHLARLAHAQTHYACRGTEDGRADGLDARGRLYLRLGEPWKVRDVHRPGVRLMRTFSIYGVPVSASDFPPAEQWLYPHIDHTGHYLFARAPTDECYTQAESMDLIPRRLQQSRGQSERGRRYAYMGLLAMEWVYEQLALYHIDYSGRYNTVANYITSQEMQAAAQSGPFNRVLPPVVDRSVGLDPPSEVLTSVASRAHVADRYDRRQRERAMPRQHTSLLARAPQLPVAVRTARFLTPDGTTRLEVHWGVQAGALAAEDSSRAGPSMLAATGVRYDGTYRRRQSRERTVRIDSAAGGAAGFVSGRLRLGATDAPAHLSMQWEHYALQEGAASGLGRKRHHAVAHADSVQPLRSDGALAMSDLVVRTGDAAAALTGGADAPLYPFSTITPQTPLLLSGEVYNLATDEGGRTRYTLSYAVAERWREGWRPLGGEGPASETGTSTTAEGTSRRTDETIQLDLSAVDPNETSEVRVTVRVTDEVAGASVERSVVFEVVPPGGRPKLGW